MSYATIPRPGTVGDNVHTKTSSLLEQLMSMNIRNPNAPASPFAPNDKQKAEMAAKAAQQAEADAVTADQRARESAKNREAYTRGWGGKAPEQPDSTPVNPESVMSIVNALTGQEQTSSEAPAGPNMPVMTPEMTAQLAAGGAASGGPASPAIPTKQSSKARAENSTPIDAKAAANVAAPADIMQSPQAGDAIKDMLEGRQKDAEGARDSAKAQALKAKDMNDGEKIFTALMAVLPGLVGAIGGGAIAGGTGAAAGAAGGLTGGANAIGAMVGEKEQLRQEALAQEAAAQGRVDKAGDQLFGHQEKLQGQEFQVGERKAGEQFRSLEREDEQAFRGTQEDKQRAFMRGQTTSNQRHDMRMLDRKHGYDMEEAYAKAAAKGPGEVKDFQQKSAEAAGDMVIAADDITKFTAGIKDNAMQSAISNSSWADVMKNPQTQKFGVAVARFMNAHLHHTTGASISEEEWKQAKAMFIPSFSDDEETKEMKRRYRIDAATAAYEGAGPAQESVQRRLKAYDMTKQGSPSAVSSNQSSSANKDAYDWLQSNPNDPRAPAIKAKLGIQ